MASQPPPSLDPQGPRIALVRNPKSHRNKNREDTPSLPSNVELVEPGTRAALDEALQAFARGGVEILAISGGDGTIRDVLTRGMAAFGDDWPQVLILPQGKTNALAVDLGIQQPWELDDALAAVERERTRVQHPLLIEDLDGNAPPVLGFLFGAGMFNVAIAAGQTAHRYGAFQGFAVAATGLFGLFQAMLGLGDTPWRRTWAMRMEADGKPVPMSVHGAPGRRYVAGFTTLRQFPAGIRPFDAIGPSKGIDFFAIDAPLRRALLKLPRALTGADGPRLRALGLHRDTAERCTIELADPYILDGETFPAGRYRLSAGPSLRFIVP